MEGVSSMDGSVEGVTQGVRCEKTFQSVAILWRGDFSPVPQIGAKYVA